MSKETEDVPEANFGIMFSGHKLFDLKACHGLPLDFAIDRIINNAGMRVEWPSFIEAARKNKWWDHQTYETLCHALQDADVPKEMREGIQRGFQKYVLINPHPMMQE